MPPPPFWGWQKILKNNEGGFRSHKKKSEVDSAKRLGDAGHSLHSVDYRTPGVLGVVKNKIKIDKFFGKRYSLFGLLLFDYLKTVSHRTISPFFFGCSEIFRDTWGIFPALRKKGGTVMRCVRQDPSIEGKRIIEYFR